MWVTVGKVLEEGEETDETVDEIGGTLVEGKEGKVGIFSGGTLGCGGKGF
jgi:hypothetical protein